MPRSLCHTLMLLLTYSAFTRTEKRSGIFSENFKWPDYYLVRSIPKGATSINVTDTSHVKNFLAVKLPDGGYVFNGHYNINPSGIYKGAGTSFTYTKRSFFNNESFYAFGPLNTSIDIMLIFNKGKSSIFYEYDMPDETTTINSNDLKALIYNTVTPLRAATRSPSSLEMSPTTPSTYSENIVRDERSSTVAPRRRRRRQYMWAALGFSKCTKSCGGGYQSIRHICVRKLKQVQVPEKYCRLLPKPESISARCNSIPCPPKWQGGQWGRCTVSCGNGTRRRELRCVQEISDSLHNRVDDRYCPRELAGTIALEERCFMPDCNVYNTSINTITTKQYIPPPHWKAEEWSPCTVTCGDGTRTRVVTCVTATGSACKASDRPAAEETCNPGACQTKSISENEIPQALMETSWMYSTWPESCPAECGTGIKTRRLYCDDYLNKPCEEKNMPIMNKTCTNQTCGQWFVGPWTQCSSSCDDGVATREVVCVSRFLGYLRVVDAQNCFGDKPDTTKGCRGPPCNATWFMSDWSPCSRSCGSGIQKRVVKCIGPDGMPINESVSECDDERRPTSKRNCNDISCDEKWEEKICRDTSPECPSLRFKTKESKNKCHLEIYKKICCKACRYHSFIASTG